MIWNRRRMPRMDSTLTNRSPTPMCKLNKTVDSIRDLDRVLCQDRLDLELLPLIPHPQFSNNNSKLDLHLLMLLKVFLQEAILSVVLLQADLQEILMLGLLETICSVTDPNEYH
jgi:hypothetical protein